MTLLLVRLATNAGSSTSPRRLAVLALALGWLAACGRERSGDPSLALRVRVSPTPAAVGPARILVELDGVPPDSAALARVTVSASLDGAPRLVDSASVEGPALQVVDGFVFPERGEWTLRVRAELPGGRWAEIEHPVRVVGGPPP